jgi:hypothetical protein
MSRNAALLAYAFLRRGAPLKRRNVAFELWPDVRAEEARAKLRRHLHRLLRALREQIACNAVTLAAPTRGDARSERSHAVPFVGRGSEMEQLTKRGYLGRNSDKP